MNAVKPVTPRVQQRFLASKTSCLNQRALAATLL